MSDFAEALAVEVQQLRRALATIAEMKITAPAQRVAQAMQQIAKAALDK